MQRYAAKRNAGQTGLPVCPSLRLLTDTESRDDGTVSLDVDLDEIVEQRTALTDHLEEAAAGVMILLVDLEVLCQVVDALGQQRDLNLGRTCIALVSSILLHDSSFFFFQHSFHPFLRLRPA